jgi:hypothetical protein
LKAGACLRASAMIKWWTAEMAGESGLYGLTP